MITEDLATLKINRLSKKQFDREMAAGRIDETAIYLTPDEFVEDEIYKGCYYRMVDDEKEWVNPPMLLNYEYRTSERYANKPVYTKHLFIEMPSSAGVKEFSTGVDALKIIRFNGMLKDDNYETAMPLPYPVTVNGQPSLVVTFVAQMVQIAMAAGYANSFATIQIWYTK